MYGKLIFFHALFDNNTYINESESYHLMPEHCDNNSSKKKIIRNNDMSPFNIGFFKTFMSHQVALSIFLFLSNVVTEKKTLIQM